MPGKTFSGKIAPESLAFTGKIQPFTDIQFC
jgi:hypothetical protein